MNANADIAPRPSILAPAGNKASFLAALAAGADAIYCGLKVFSARMEAKNFSEQDLIALVELAHENGVQVFVTLNSLLKPDELGRAAKILAEFSRQVKPDALIIQDLALVPLARQTGFAGQIHLSTLANVSFSMALKLVRQELQVDRVVLPRELDIDEIKTLAGQCPPGLGLELFVHGALCYGVSGRCYWSSYFGGKSGLRGRCVQPCRRLYRQQTESGRFFSCLDLSLDVLTKVLQPLPQVRAWKIEGRKKGPHYVYYAVQGYRMLRDEAQDPQMKKNALQMLSRALGRNGTHYHFLPQRPQNPVRPDAQTGSGLLVGNMKGTRQRPFLVPQEELIPGDVLRLGYEDEPWHSIARIGRHVPRGGRFYVQPSSKKQIAKGTPVFLIDRREKQLSEMIAGLERQLRHPVLRPESDPVLPIRLPANRRKKEPVLELHVGRKLSQRWPGPPGGLWLSAKTLKDVAGSRRSNIWWWLPPVIWPEEEPGISALVVLARQAGARQFVLNAPWQVAFFGQRKGVQLWAGPFCNLTNALALQTIKSLGFSGAIVSPELGREDYLSLALRRPMPLGIVISGNWPLCVARVVPENLEPERPFTSPRGEQAWVVRYDRNFWVFPNWKLDLGAQKQELQAAGFSLFVHLQEPVPKAVTLKKRPGMWNWKLGLV